MDKHSDTPAETPPIEDRSDTGRGFWNVGWPLLALGLIALMAVHSCLPR